MECSSDFLTLAKVLSFYILGLLGSWGKSIHLLIRKNTLGELYAFRWSLLPLFLIDSQVSLVPFAPPQKFLKSSHTILSHLYHFLTVLPLLHSSLCLCFIPSLVYLLMFTQTYPLPFSLLPPV